MVELTLPLPDESLERFRIWQSPILPDSLADALSFRSFLAQGMDTRTATVRLDVSFLGLHAMILDRGKAVIVEPLQRGNTEEYRSFHFPGMQLVEEAGGSSSESLSSESATSSGMSFGDTLRVARLVLNATGEFTQFYGGVDTASAVIATIGNRATGVFEQEVGIRFVFASHGINAFADTTDPFPDAQHATRGALMDSNQVVCDRIVGEDNYDLGHLIALGIAGGTAGKWMCQANKGKAVSRFPDNPDSLLLALGYVVHELGHQAGILGPGAESYNTLRYDYQLVLGELHHCSGEVEKNAEKKHLGDTSRAAVRPSCPMPACAPIAAMSRMRTTCTFIHSPSSRSHLATTVLTMS